MAVRVVLYCRAVLCCGVLLLPFVVLVYASTEDTKNVVLLAESAQESCQIIKKYVLVKKSAQATFLGKAMYHAGRYV